MTWYRLDLGTADLATQALDALAAAVDAAWRAAGRPPDFAAYERPESVGGLHCHRVVYFTPAAESVARQRGARACAEPGPWDLGLLAGGQKQPGD